MFVRFRETARRLQASLVTTARAEGKVRHEHIGALGSVPRSPSPADRIAFWTKLHQRLDALSNRIDAAQRGAILTAVHSRIPMPTLDELRQCRRGGVIPRARAASVLGKEPRQHRLAAGAPGCVHVQHSMWRRS
jgi:hypothetical protein